MGKILFWLIAILVVLTVWRMLNARGQKPRSPDAAARKAGGAGAEPMVRCAHCGIHLPRSEALQSQGQTWCSQEHARLGARQP